MWFLSYLGLALVKPGTLPMETNPTNMGTSRNERFATQYSNMVPTTKEILFSLTKKLLFSRTKYIQFKGSHVYSMYEQLLTFFNNSLLLTASRCLIHPPLFKLT